MAFQSYDQYIQNFGAALAGAAQPTPIIPQPAGGGAFGGAPPAGPVSPPAPQPQVDPAAGAFGAAPGAAAGPATPAAPSGPMSPAMPPSGPMSQAPGAAPSGAFTPAKEEAGPTGLSMHKLFEDSSEEEREQFATEMEAQVPDVIAAANAAAEQDPEGASKWDSFLSKRGWNRQEASAWLMEFGLRMLQAGGSGEGNFLSDVGGSAMGATEARRAFKTEEEEKGFKREDREWEAKKRERDEGKWEAEDREETRDRKRKSADEMRKGETHELNKLLAEKNLKNGTWTTTINEDGNVVFTDPNTKEKWDTGIKASSRDAHGRASAFAEQLDAWRQTASGLNETSWSDMSAKQRAMVDNAYFEYQKTGVNTKAARAKFIGDWVMSAKESMRSGARNDPDAVRQVENEAVERATEMANSLFGAEEDGVGGIPVFKDPVPAWAADE